MVIIHMAMHFEGLQNLVKLCSVGNRHVNCMGGIDTVLNVLVIDADWSAGLEIAVNDHRDFCIHDCASCESSADCLINLLRICACLCSKYKSLRDHRNRIIHDHLICEFCC